MKKTEKYRDFNVWANAEVFLLGFILIGTQIVLLREFMLVFTGNELVIGLLLAFWMLISGAGAWSGKNYGRKRSTQKMLPLLFLLLSVFPLLSAYSLGYIRTFFIEAGRMISFYETMGFAFALLFPVCFIGGLLFTVLNYSVENGSSNPQKLYAFESLGSLAGGIIVSVVFIYFLNADNFKSLEYLALISFLVLGVLSFRKKEMGKSAGFLFLAISVLMLIQFFDLAHMSRQNLYPDQVLISTTNNPYGSIDITKNGSQQNIYENGLIIYTSDDFIRKEEDVHYAMLQRPDAKQILLLGGGISGTPGEILKYRNVEKIDYLELNPALFKLATKFSDVPNDKQIRKIEEDAIIFVKATNTKYDIVLINEPPPFDLRTNRFYTVEFYRNIKNVLQEGGVISCRLPASENYQSTDELLMQSVIFKSLSTVFHNVQVIPGKQHYFLASDDSLSFHYSGLYATADIKTRFVNANYLNDRLLQMRSQTLQKDYLDEVSLNYDFKPSVYLTFINRWLSFYGNSFQIILLIVLFMGLFLLLLTKPTTTAMFTSGFTGASVEIVLLIAFQSILGYLYLFLGLLITVFMGGLAVGSFLSHRFKLEKPLVILYIQLSSALFILLIPVFLMLTKMLTGPIAIQVVFAILMFVVAVFVGLQYGSIVRSGFGTDDSVSTIYPADLLGAGLGSFITALWLVPVFGIYTSLFILAAFHIVTVGIVILKRKYSTFKG